VRTAKKLAFVAAALAASGMFGAPAAHASGDAPWCSVTEVAEGATAWNCEYETVEECLPSVTSGNRGSCSPNPYAAPAPVSAPASEAAPTTPNATSSTTQNRKAKRNAK
jgi:Protein of unknown function (DUF3551)